MIKVARLLKDEVKRLARKEAKTAVATIRKPSLRLRRAVAELRTKVVGLEKELKRLSTTLAAIPRSNAAAEPEEAQRGARITAKGMRSLRRKLRLTRDQFGALIGVSPQSVYLWEHRDGPLHVRHATRAAIVAIRGLGAREAKARLEQKAAPQKPAAAKAKRGRAKKA